MSGDSPPPNGGTVRAIIGWSFIGGEELGRLRAGDVVLLEELWAQPDRRQGGRAELLTADGARFAARLTVEDGGYVAHVLEPTAVAVEGTLVEASLRSAAVEGPLEVGAVVPLGVAPEEPLELIAESRPVARGRIVRVDGERGLQVLALCR